MHSASDGNTTTCEHCQDICATHFVLSGHTTELCGAMQWCEKVQNVSEFTNEAIFFFHQADGET